MIINNIINGLKRFFLGSTYKFTTRKGSTNFSGASWTRLYCEMTETPVKLVSIEFKKEVQSPAEYRLRVDGEKIFPFGAASNLESGVSRNFMIPIDVASDSFFEVEVKGGVKDRSVVILSELALIEVH